MAKILLADDHDLVRETIADYLRRQGGVEVICAESLFHAAEVAKGFTQESAQESAAIDLVLLDYAMPGMDSLTGLDTMMELVTCPVAIFSGIASSDVAHKALAAGASGFLPKTLTPEALLSAVHYMLAGNIFRPKEFLEGLEWPDDINLTPRERDVLRGLCAGRTNKEIARDHNIQEVTVKLHVKTLSRKLDARNRTHAAMLARDFGLI